MNYTPPISPGEKILHQEDKLWITDRKVISNEHIYELQGCYSASFIRIDRGNAIQISLSSGIGILSFFMLFEFFGTGVYIFNLICFIICLAALVEGATPHYHLLLVGKYGPTTIFGFKCIGKR